jgi:hypothetical protein
MDQLLSSKNKKEASPEEIPMEVRAPEEIPMEERAPEDRPYEHRWWSWHDETSTATLDFSIASDGVVTVTVSGVQAVNPWEANLDYLYTAKANKRHIYEFEAWKDQYAEGRLLIQYYWDEDDRIPLKFEENEFVITETRTTYRLMGQAILKSGVRCLEFQCAAFTGTFYIKVISITEE